MPAHDYASVADARRLALVSRTDGGVQVPLDASALEILLAPDTGRIVDASRAVCSLLGYDPSDMPGLPIERVHPHDLKAVNAFARYVLEEGQGQSSNLSCMSKAGMVIPVDVHGTRLTTQAGTRILAALERRPAQRWAGGGGVPERGASTGSGQAGAMTSEAGVEADAAFAFPYGIIGSSSAIQEVLTRINLVSPTRAPVLILGETGTGKELVARAIHRAGPRANKPFVRLNCAAVPPELFEAELFGHARGAFTGALAARVGRIERADGGTLFLDEIGELPHDLQSKLLVVLQDGQYERLGESHTRRADFRIIAATNRDMKHEVMARRFRMDLFYRINVFPIPVPPLRRRAADIAELIEHFIQRSAREMATSEIALSDRQLSEMMRYDWPGNIRELRNFVERASIWARAGVMPSLRDDAIEAGPERGGEGDERIAPMTEKERTARDRKNLLDAIKRCHGRIHGVHGAATLLGIPASTFRSRMKALGIARGAAIVESLLTQ